MEKLYEMFSTNNSLYKNISNDVLLTTFSKLTIPFDEKCFEHQLNSLPLGQIQSQHVQIPQVAKEHQIYLYFKPRN